MYKKFLLAIIIIALLAAGVIAYQRHQVENAQRTVELILDLEQWQKLNLAEEVELATLLAKYKQQGVTSLALREESLEQLLKKGELSLVSSLDFKLLKELSGVEEEMFSQLDAQGAQSYLLYDRVQTKERILKNLEAQLGAETLLVVKPELQLIAINATQQELLNLKLGFSPAELELATELGFKVVPRFSNQSNISPQLIKTKFENLDLVALEDTSQVIFSGSEVVGYPQDLEVTASFLAEYQLKLGMIEDFIASQRGARTLANLSQLSSVRVHSASQEEFNQLSNFRLIARYLRAVRERGVRSLYLKPVLANQDSLSALEASDHLIANLVSTLENNNYSLGVAQPIARYSSQALLLLLLNFGIWAAFFYLLEYLWISNFPFALQPRTSLIIFLSLALLSTIVLLGGGMTIFNRQLMALLAALVFPVLAIVASLFPYLFSKEELNTNSNVKIKELFKVYLKVNLITGAGGFILTGALSDWRFFLDILQFRGVKVALFAPLILFLAYYLHYSFYLNNQQLYLRGFKRELKGYLNRFLCFKDLLLLIFLVFAVILYTVRSGNQPLIPVANFELLFRDWMESLFLVRPRFKSFLIGHPLLLLGIWLTLQDSKKLSSYLLGGALIGQITIINTFSHLHTPLWISSWRALSGIILGAVWGLILIKLLGNFMIEDK